MPMGGQLLGCGREAADPPRLSRLRQSTGDMWEFIGQLALSSVRVSPRNWSFDASWMRMDMLRGAAAEASHPRHAGRSLGSRAPHDPTTAPHTTPRSHQSDRAEDVREARNTKTVT